MKNKCLGCGKPFQDKINICNECLAAIQKTREQINPLPRKFYLSTKLWGRKLALLLALINLILVFQATILAFSQFLPAIINETGNKPVLGMIVFNIPWIIFFVFGFFLGESFNRRGIKTIVKLWADKEFYALNNWFLFKKYWLPVSPVYAAYFVILIAPVFLIGYLWRPSILIWALKVPSVYALIFCSGLFLGASIFSFSFVVGFFTAYYFSTRWISRLTK